jgi:zinc transport system substrate-binding protein
MVEHTRRGLLKAGGSALCVGMTGCLNGDTTEGKGFVAQVSFPVVYDLAENVVPDGAEAENLVPVGQHGHGWEPSPDVQRKVTSADAFVYVFEGFQPWADDVITSLERDHPEVAVVEAGRDVELLEVGEGGHGNDGGSEGESHDSGGEGDGHDDGHDHDGNTNPHFWLDPLRAKTAVGTVAEGLAEAHGEGGYAENADAYGSRLDGLHEEFESSLSNASKDAVLVAGHNAFAYLGERYGFRVETLTGVSPDEQPSPRDIRRAQELIDAEGIEYVLSPVFESDRAARGLVEDTAAEGVLPITAFAGFAQEWLDNDWGYVEVMRNVNLSSLERALEA